MKLVILFLSLMMLSVSVLAESYKTKGFYINLKNIPAVTLEKKNNHLCVKLSSTSDGPYTNGNKVSVAFGPPANSSAQCRLTVAFFQGKDKICEVNFKKTLSGDDIKYALSIGELANKSYSCVKNDDTKFTITKY